MLTIYLAAGYVMDSAEVIEFSGDSRMDLKNGSLARNSQVDEIILVRDVVKPIRNDDGILTMSVYDFLMGANSLDV